MMEKYGIDQKTYRVVKTKFGFPSDKEIIVQGVSLGEAEGVQKNNPNSIIEPD